MVPKRKGGRAPRRTCCRRQNIHTLPRVWREVGIRVRASSHVLYYLFFVVESAPRHMTSVLSV